MRVDLDAEAFTDADALPELLNLMRCFASGRHDWLATPETDAAGAYYFTEHAPRLAGTFAALGRKGAVAVAWQGTEDAIDAVRVTKADLADYAADLCRAAVLVLENQDSDGSFIRTVARVFRVERLEQALAEGWLELDHGGGDTLVSVTKAQAAHFRRRPRVAALLDSDRLVPGEPTRAHAKADDLQQHGVVVHVLELREAENYVPFRVLHSVGKAGAASRRLDALKLLTPQQRGHIDMKTGFGPPTDPPIVPGRQKRLFDGVPMQVLLRLRGGFGKDLLKRMEAMRDRLHERDFTQLGEDVAEELRRMLATLARVI